MTHTVTRWWWVRHAPVVGVHGRVYGQDDIEADCADEAQFRHLAGLLPHDAVWLVSHLKRTHQTASAIFAARVIETVPAPIITSDLAEQHFGDWQGMTYEELHQSRGGAFHRFWHGPAHQRVPGGESFADLMARVSWAILQLVEAHRGKNIIGVAHGGTIRAALGLALGLEPEHCLAFTMENCSLTRIDHIEGPGMGHNWRVITVNRPPK